MRLIDADALLKTHCNECTLYPNDCLGDGCDNGAAIHIKEAPTVDAVPVVRCKDCIRWRQSKSDTTAMVCDWDRYEKTEKDYCSWAKSKDDD